MENQKVGVWKSVLFTVCSIIALESFAAPSIIGASSITVWIAAAALFFIPYGLISAELGAAYPDDGGIYAWIKRAFGDGLAVLSGWFYWVNTAFWMPAVFVAFSYWFSFALFPDAPPWLMGGLALAMCWLVVLIGVRGVGVSVTITSIAGVAKMAILVIFGVLGVVYGIEHGFANDFSLGSFVPTWENATRYLSVVVFSLMGFELIGAIGSKIKEPGKTVPRMTALACALLTFLFVFGTFGILCAVPAGEIDAVGGFFHAMRTVCSVLGSAQDPVFYTVMVVAMLTLVSNVVSWALGANEVLSAAGIDKRSRLLALRSRKYDTPAGLYLVMGVISTVLIVLNYSLGGSANEIFWTLLSFSMLIFMVPYLLMFPAVYVLRVRDGATPRPYKVPGGKVGLTVCVVLCEAFIALSIFFMFKDAGTGYALWVLILGSIITTALGLLLYRAGRK